MTMWTPDLQTTSQPLYIALADAIESDIAAGKLNAGDRLPTHRDLARALHVTIGTITRGYREAQRRGLTTGEVGRGSFVREQAARGTRLTWDGLAQADRIVMSQNFPLSLPETEQRCIGPIVRDIADDISSVMGVPWPGIVARHQRAGAKWLERYRVEAAPEQVLISTGFQPALWATISALCEAGDVVLADQLTTPGLLTLSGSLKVRVIGVGGDEQGMLPEALERAIADHQPRLVYLTPTVQTPTGIVMPESRRRSIADVIHHHALLAIEDDDTTPLLSSEAVRPPAMASLAPDLAFLVADVSRALGLGIRLSYVLSPRACLAQTNTALMGTTWMPVPLIAEVVARLIDSGVGQSVIDARREELRERWDLVERVLTPERCEHSEAAHHLWLKLPEQWRSESFAAEAGRRGVSINSSSTFAVHRAQSPGAVRVCIAAPSQRSELERGLRVLAELITTPRARDAVVV